MSVPQPWPRRRPVLLGVLSVLALLNLVVNVSGLLRYGSSPVRWVIAGLWLVVLAVCFLGWRRQVRRFDEREAERERESGAGGPSDPRGPVGPST